VLRKCLFLVCLLSLAAVQGSDAQASAQLDTANSWIATSSSGRTFIGTWTVVANATSDTVRGTWTLVDREARTLAFGEWGAAKSPKGWTGSWKANVDRREGTYGGTWSSNIQLRGSARFADLFSEALRATVGGRWRFGGYSGTWAIRAYHH